MGRTGQKFSSPYKMIIQNRQKALREIAYFTACQFSRTASSESYEAILLIISMFEPISV